MMYDQVLSRLLGKYSNLFFYTLEEHNTHSHLIITVSKTLILSLQSTYFNYRDMPKRKRCPICQEDFPPRSYYRHYASYFDQKTNSWLDHGEAAVKEESDKRFKNLIDDFSKASDQPGIYNDPFAHARTHTHTYIYRYKL